MFGQPNIQCGAVTEFSGRQPVEVLVAFTSPLDFILPAMATTLSDDDLVDHPFFYAVVDDRWWLREVLSRVSKVVVRVEGNELRGVESGADVRGVREV